MVQIDFDKPRNLKFDLAAVRDLEANLGGKPLGSIINDLSNIGVNTIVFALWAGLKHEDPTLNPKLVERMLTKYIAQKKSLRLIGRKLNEGIEETGLFRNEDDEVEEGNEQTTTVPA